MGRLSRSEARLGTRQLTYRDPSMRLKQSSMTTSSSLPKISEIFPAIHLDRE